MGLGVVTFAELPVRVGARGVEIAQGDELQPVGPVIVAEDLLDEELGLAVGIEGTEAMILGDGDLARHAVDGRARGEDEGFDPGFEHGVEKVQARAEVLGGRAPRMDIGLAHLDEGGEVEDGVDTAGFEDGPDVLLVLEIPDDELALPDELPLPRGEVVEDDD